MSQGNFEIEDPVLDVHGEVVDIFVTLLDNIGPAGEKGDTGDTGAQGIQGIQGIKGDTGDTGSQGIQGIQGIKGDKGDTGDQGDTGDTGAQGIQGIQGIQGDPGDDGSPGSVWRDGSGAPSNGLGVNGDYYLDDTTGNVYLKAAGSYSIVANIKGATGNTGTTGAAGSAGATGAPGSVWRDGSGAPSSGLGINGDYYLDDTTGNVYLKAAGSYSIVGNIKGADGADGADGSDGSPGAPGSTGATGAAGSVWRDGSGAPSNGLGINGDYYLDDATGNVYLKAGGTYSVVANIKGATGSTGSTGSTGAAGSTGATGAAGSVWRDGSGAPSSGLGVNGDYYLDDSTGDVYLKASGSYSIVSNIKGATGASGSSSISVHQVAHSLAVGDIIRFDGTNYVKAKADSAANAEAVGIVSATSGADDFSYIAGGMVTGLSSLTAGGVYFLSDATAGLLTLTSPTTIGSVSKPVFVAVSTTSGVFANMRGQVIANAGADGWLEAGETWTYASADAPTFTFTVASDVTTKYAAGQRVKLTQTTVKYFIITAVSTYSGGNTTITVYGGTDYTLANAAISGPSYSLHKAPFGFPLDPSKWTVETSSSSTASQSSPTSGTWYNLGSISISIPIGIWNVYYVAAAHIVSSTTPTSQVTTLSTANNSEIDTAWSSYNRNAVTGQVVSLAAMQRRDGVISLATKTTYYLNSKTANSSVTSIAFEGTVGKTLIRAVCAYL